MTTGKGIPEHWRPTMKNSLHRSPLLRSTLALGIAATLAMLPRLAGAQPGSIEAFTLYGVAIVAVVAGTLVLIQSAAIRRIRYLRTSSKEQLDELARATLYTEQISAALGEVFEFRAQPRNADPMPLIDRLLDSAATRASVAFDPSIRFYVVESTASHHVVKARGGSENFAIEVGKSCPADRSLEEVASGLGACWRIAPVSIRGTKCNLVMLSDRFPTRADCGFVEQLALVLSLADGRLGLRSQGSSRSQARLRAV